MTAQQLKNSILQMAVQGKLVPQDPNDEPASVLLERIRAEKEEMIKAGKIKKEKNPSVIFRGDDNLFYEKVGNQTPVCIEDDLPFEIPESWEWVRFASVIELQSGQDMAPDKYNTESKGMPYITGASNIESEAVIINRWTEYGKTYAYNGDILLTCKGTVGKMAILNEPKVHIARQIMAIRPSSLLNVKYIMMVLDSMVAILNAAAKSMIPGIAREDILSSIVALPPRLEQDKICEKYESTKPLLKDCFSNQALLEHLNTTFPDQLKKSILQMAVQGKLVPQDPNDEPASVLLEKIRTEKEQLIQAGKIKRDKHESVIYRRDGSYYEKVDGTERCIDEEIPFDIPESWEWTRIGHIFNLQAGKNIRASEIHEKINSNEYPCFGGNGLRGYVSVYNRDGYYALIGRQGALCGNINYARGKFYATEHAVVVDNYGLTNTKWSGLFLEALNLNQYATATAQPGLAVRNINTILLPLPPLVEQERIVKKTNQLLAACNNL